jgi:TPR repeat protein
VRSGNEAKEKNGQDLMGTMVQVWESQEAATIPPGYEHALADVDRARARPQSPDARLVALRAALLDRYPLASHDAPRAAVWLGDGLAHVPVGAAWDIAVVATQAEEVVPYLVVQALRLGLNVHDVQARAIHLADGRCLAEDPAAAACVEALAPLGQGDQRTAHATLVRLAAAGNARAYWYLGVLYDEGGFVQCNAVIACALFCAATGWRVLEGAFAPTAEAADAQRQDFARAYRERLGATIAAAADALLLRLKAPGAFEATLREAGGERDAQFAAALSEIDRGEAAAAAMRLAPLAARGHAHAQRALVRLWAAGTPADDAVREIEWTRAAAQAGDDVAMARMAAFHEEGARLPLDPAEAAQWLRRIAREGRTGAARAAAVAALARLEQARTVDPDVLRARAAAGDAAAAFELACLHREAGPAQDPEAALAWFNTAAEAGHAEAQVELAFLHDTGVGVPQDAAVATHWYGLAAAQGHAFAQCRYALRLAEGVGIERDRRRMVHWLAQAARQNDGEALQQLGRVLAGGLGVRRDPIAAQALFVLAGRHGAPQPAFFGAGEADPRAVRRLVERIDAGVDLVEALGLAHVPAARADAPAGADMPAAAPSIRPAFRRESDEAVLARFEADRRARQAACAEAVRAAVPAFVASLVLVACLLHFLDRMPAALPGLLWLSASALAARAVGRVNRARGVTRARLAHAAVMFTPVFGQMFVALWLYRSWRQIQ